jgi:hypothetical protein
MSHDDLNNLPPPMRESLLAEIDPGETLRWCGQPHPRRVATLTALPVLVLALFFGLFFGGMLLAMGYAARAELLGVPFWWGRPSAERPSWTSVWVSLTLGWLVLLASLVGPALLAWSEVRRARRTVYAVTDTRVFRLLVSREGRARVHAVEPGHPLSLSRHDLADGRGDIQLYPSSARSGFASMKLIGIADARSVERLIRSTFDPPGSAKEGGGI